MQSTEQKLREALSELIEAYNRAGPELSRAERAVDRMRLIAAHEALSLPTDDVKSVLQGALNVLGCLEYGITGVDSWPCEDSVENVVHRIRKVLEESQ